MKNNIIEAVMIPFDRYEKLSELKEREEHKEIFSMVQDRISHYDASKTVSLSSLQNK
jgi:hypothetical protein